MKPEFQVYIKDPSNVSPEERNVTKKFLKLIKSRFEESTSLSKHDGVAYVGLFFNKAEIPQDFQKLNSKVYYRNLFTQAPLDWQAFEISLKAGLKLVDVTNINNICVAIGENVFSEEDLFAINRNTSDAPKYIAIDPIYSLDEVIMNSDEKESILRALTIVSEKELIFEKWGFSKIDKNTKSILCFHGAAGTGKTMCAHAVAKHLNKKILIGSYSQIQSKFVGEGEKNLVAYFEAAEEQDAVLFIDEADTFLSRRLPSSNENSKHYNSMSNELYTLIENFNGCIVFASNHIKDFDPAVISRIIEPIEFKLPNAESRKKIIQRMLPEATPIELNDSQISQLVVKSDGFSGRDIRKAMLIFFSSAAYKYKTIQKLKDDEIKFVFDDILSAFVHVRKNKDELKQTIKGINTNSIIVESARRNTRILQVAANALWVDDRIDEKEKMLFNELSAKLGATIDIENPQEIPLIDEICDTILSKTEKIQMLDVACRMIAIDGTYDSKEKEFVTKLSILLGLKPEKKQELDDYINHLIKENLTWNDIVESWNKSEHDILTELKKEYSEGAAWFKLGQSYLHGETLFDSVIPQSDKRAKYCFEMSTEKGYNAAKEELEKLL